MTTAHTLKITVGAMDRQTGERTFYGDCKAAGCDWSHASIDHDDVTSAYADHAAKTLPVPTFADTIGEASYRAENDAMRQADAELTELAEGIATMTVTPSLALAETVLAPGLKLPNGAEILASAPASGTMPRFIVLAAVKRGHRIAEYAVWEASVSLAGIETYWGAYFPLGEIGAAVASYANRTGTLANLADAVANY